MRKMYLLITGILALGAGIVLNSCMTEDGNRYDNMPEYWDAASNVNIKVGSQMKGNWTMGGYTDMVNGGNSIGGNTTESVSGKAVMTESGEFVFSNLPCSDLLISMFPAEPDFKEAQKNAEMGEYKVKFQVSGYSSENVYLRFDKADYVFYTTVKGTRYEVILNMSDENVAAINSNNRRFVAKLTVRGIRMRVNGTSMGEEVMLNGTYTFTANY